MATTLARSASAAPPLRVVAIADGKHTYEGHTSPLYTIKYPILLGADGEVAFDSEPAFGTPIMEKGGKLVTVDTVTSGTGSLLSRFGDLVFFQHFEGKNYIQARDPDGTVSTLLEEGEAIEGQVVGLFSNIRTNERGDVIVADGNAGVFSRAYKGPKKALSMPPNIGGGAHWLDKTGKYYAVLNNDTPIPPAPALAPNGIAVWTGMSGAAGTKQLWWEEAYPGSPPNAPSYPTPIGVGRTGIVVAWARAQAGDGSTVNHVLTGSVGAPAKVFERPGPLTLKAADPYAGGHSVCMMRNNDFASDESNAEGETQVMIVEGGSPRVLAGKDTTVDGYHFVSRHTAGWASNDVGQLAFVHDVTNGSETVLGLFLYTPGKGIETILRVGQEVEIEPGKKVTVHGIAISSACNGGEAITLDDQGRIAAGIDFNGDTGASANAVVVSGATSALGTADLELGEPRNLVAKTKRYQMGVGYQSWVDLEFDIPAKNLGPEAASTTSLDVVLGDETGPDGKQVVSRTEFSSVSEGNAPVCERKVGGGYSNRDMSCALKAFEPSRERLIHLVMLVVVSSNSHVGKEVSFELVLNSPNEGRFDNNTRRVTFKVPPDQNALGSSEAGCSTLAPPHTDGFGLGAGLAALGLLWGVRRRRRTP
ncbi:MAG: hypothetical protein KIT84_00395 [Labilithrix sp.]|nr:hypothetical protein [Labilithrix sp.]MCW5809442.1 hypothetical protein [Labilithrix sp.]